MPSPGRKATPPLDSMKSGNSAWVLRSTGFGYAAVWQKLCNTKSAENPRQANSFNSSRVIGPVVSWLPTVLINGSQLLPGRTPTSPQALPTIFWAKVKPLILSIVEFGRINTSDIGMASCILTLSVKARPINSGIRPPACTSSHNVVGFNVNLATISPHFSSPIARSIVPS